MAKRGADAQCCNREGLARATLSTLRRNTVEKELDYKAEYT